MSAARPIVAIVGPTAVGKTEVGIEVALRIGGEIISADSMAVYRGLDVGTAKPTPKQQALVRFHCVDVAEPTAEFDVAKFVSLAQQALAEIEARGARALLVGGTGLYVKCFLEQFSLAQTVADPAVRAALQREAATGEPGELHRRLAELDPASAARIHPNDLVRTIRALEVQIVSGEKLSDKQQRDSEQRTPLPSIRFGLRMEKDKLAARILERTSAMVRAGLRAEVTGLLEAGVPRSCRALDGLGYRETCTAIEQGWTDEQLVEEISRRTRAYAKRQMTWFRADKQLHWIDVDERAAADIADEVVGMLPQTGIAAM